MSLDEILRKLWQHAQVYEKVKGAEEREINQTKQSIQKLMLGEDELKKIIESKGIYLTPELSAFSMHIESIDKLAKTLSQKMKEKLT